jgi:hypothetical protein
MKTMKLAVMGVMGLMLFGCEKPKSSVETVSKQQVAALKAKLDREKEKMIEESYQNDLKQIRERAVAAEGAQRVAAAKAKAEAAEQHLQDAIRAYDQKK